jgi:hypothetical protein
MRSGGKPALFKRVLNVLRTLRSSSGVPMVDVKTSPFSTPTVSAHDFPDNGEVFVKWLPRVVRFSFDVAKVVRLPNQPFETN